MLGTTLFLIHSVSLSLSLSVFFNELFLCDMFIYLQKRNLRIVYDAIGTLADAVGRELNQVLFSPFGKYRTLSFSLLLCSLHLFLMMWKGRS